MADEGVQLTPAEIIELVAHNAEMRRLLGQHQWSGLTPLKSAGVCPECCGSSRTGHRRGCAIAAVLEAADFS